jgi:drug/metabolite transporter (DMT)-like permease
VKLREWGAFTLLGLIWGTSFLWIKLAVADIGPFMLAAWRLLFGLAGLLVVMRLQHQSLPRERNVLLAFVFIGIVNTAMPFVLIPWGERLIDSGLASILNGTVPLFTIVIAHFWLHDEKITMPRIAGLVVGFTGVVVLVSRDIRPEGLHGDVWGQIAVLAASVCYATAITFSRRYVRGQPPVVQSFTTLLVADALIWLAVPLAEPQPLHWPSLPLTWIALIWLGLLGSCVAYLLFFGLINAWGPTRASLVTYVFPVVGLILGVTINHEPIDWQLVVGSLLIVGGIGVVNLRLGTPAAEQPAEPAS